MNLSESIQHPRRSVSLSVTLTACSITALSKIWLKQCWLNTTMITISGSAALERLLVLQDIQQIDPQSVKSAFIKPIPSASSRIGWAIRLLGGLIGIHLLSCHHIAARLLPLGLVLCCERISLSFYCHHLLNKQQTKSEIESVSQKLNFWINDHPNLNAVRLRDHLKQGETLLAQPPPCFSTTPILMQWKVSLVDHVNNTQQRIYQLQVEYRETILQSVRFGRKTLEEATPILGGQEQHIQQLNQHLNQMESLSPAFYLTQRLVQDQCLFIEKTCQSIQQAVIQKLQKERIALIEKINTTLSQLKTRSCPNPSSEIQGILTQLQMLLGEAERNQLSHQGILQSSQAVKNCVTHFDNSLAKRLQAVQDFIQSRTIHQHNIAFQTLYKQLHPLLTTSPSALMESVIVEFEIASQQADQERIRTEQLAYRQKLLQLVSCAERILEEAIPVLGNQNLQINQLNNHLIQIKKINDFLTEQVVYERRIFIEQTCQSIQQAVIQKLQKERIALIEKINTTLSQLKTRSCPNPSSEIQAILTQLQMLLGEAERNQLSHQGILQSSQSVKNCVDLFDKCLTQRLQKVLAFITSNISNSYYNELYKKCSEFEKNKTILTEQVIMELEMSAQKIINSPSPVHMNLTHDASLSSRLTRPTITIPLIDSCHLYSSQLSSQFIKSKKITNWAKNLTMLSEKFPGIHCELKEESALIKFHYIWSEFDVVLKETNELDIPDINDFLFSAGPTRHMVSKMNDYFGLLSESKEFSKVKEDTNKLANDIKSNRNNREFITKIPNNCQDFNTLMRAYLTSHRGVVIGENHLHVSPKKLLIDNLSQLRQQGVTILFLEHIAYDRSQKQLDECFLSAGQSIDPLLKKILGRIVLSSQQLDRAQCNYDHLVIAAAKVGIRVVAIDTAATYSLAIVDQNNIRTGTMNVVANKIIQAHLALEPPNSKFIALVGETHAGYYRQTRYDAVEYLGLGELLDCPVLIVADAKQSHLKYGVNGYKESVDRIDALLEVIT